MSSEQTARKQLLLWPKQKKTPTHPKRQLLIDTDGWTHVVNRPQQRQLGSREDIYGHPPPASADMTLAEMCREHQRCRQQWERSDACHALQARISGSGAGAGAGGNNNDN